MGRMNEEKEGTKGVERMERTRIGRQEEYHIQFAYTNLARHLGCTSGWKDGRPSTSGAAGS